MSEISKKKLYTFFTDERKVEKSKACRHENLNAQRVSKIEKYRRRRSKKQSSFIRAKRLRLPPLNVTLFIQLHVYFSDAFFFLHFWELCKKKFSCTICIIDLSNVGTDEVKEWTKIKVKIYVCLSTGKYGNWMSRANTGDCLYLLISNWQKNWIKKIKLKAMLLRTIWRIKFSLLLGESVRDEKENLITASPDPFIFPRAWGKNFWEKHARELAASKAC